MGKKEAKVEKKLADADCRYHHYYQRFQHWALSAFSSFSVVANQQQLAAGAVDITPDCLEEPLHMPSFFSDRDFRRKSKRLLAGNSRENSSTSLSDTV